MTKPSCLVLEGNEVKLRLEAERIHTLSPVHVDWLRFTVNLRHAPVPTVEHLFPAPEVDDCLSRHELDEQSRRRLDVVKLLRGIPDPDFAASTQALELANNVCEILGVGFHVDPEIKKGHDFYKHRWSIVRAGAECGWVGYLASGDSPRQQAQSKTLHVNLYGNACTFARPGWPEEMAGYLEDHRAVITRCDLALDFFDGIAGGMDRVASDYDLGLMDHLGHRPDHNCVGAWRPGGKGRSFYFGSKAAGKQTNVYDKGVQLYGKQDATGWQRIELRYGSQKRLLPVDMLRRPAHFFAGASNWHALLLAEHGAVVIPEPVKTEPRLPVETLQAECTRNARWFFSTAGKSAALAFLFMDLETISSFIENCAELPGRLSKFSRDEVKRVYQQVFKNVSASGVGRVGFQAA
ncbi:MAG: replication initiation factor domain-containing protein [Proteobacteria bacterium]|nr:replication initiation factor domain-containing protein [Pseudomonadota bacterium]